MKTMNIGLISDNPLHTTGFGVACDQIARQLVRHGHNVTCFAANNNGIIDPSAVPYHLWIADKHSQVETFLRQLRLDLAIIVGSITHMSHVLRLALQHISTGTTLAAHILAEGMPVGRRYVEDLRRVPIVIAATRALQRHLQTDYGIPSVSVPYGVDVDEFRPWEFSDRERIRAALGLSDRFLVGVFGRNNERKQQPRIFEAVRILRHEHGMADVRVYAHCLTVDHSGPSGWDLREVACQLGVDDVVMFPTAHSAISGCARSYDDRTMIPTSIDQLSYVSRLNLCDVTINAAYAGGYEFNTLESQACGVPSAITNDHGNMAEVAGDGSILMDASYGIHYSGALQYFVEPCTIARHIVRLREDAAYRDELVMRGFVNAQRLSTTACGDILANALETSFRQRV